MCNALLTTQDCLRCPALVASRRRIVHGYGNPLSRIVFIGEAPGRHGADRTGVPFSGDRSGRTLQGILVALDLMDGPAPTNAPRLRCFVTNVVRCCPPENRTPTAAEQAACAAFLARELDALDPLVIAAVGLVALRAVGLRYLGAAPAAIRALHAVPLQGDGRVIVPLIHPARIARTQIDAFVATMKAVLVKLQIADCRLQ